MKLSTIKNLILSIVFLLLFSCELGDDGATNRIGSIEFTINGASYSSDNVNEALYSEVTERAILNTGCSNCPYALEFQFFGGFNPRTLSSEGSVDNGDLARINITLRDLEFQPETGADEVTLEITEHNSSNKTFSANFTFYLNADQEYNGSGTLTDIPYE